MLTLTQLPLASGMLQDTERIRKRARSPLPSVVQLTLTVKLDSEVPAGIGNVLMATQLLLRLRWNMPHSRPARAAW